MDLIGADRDLTNRYPQSINRLMQGLAPQIILSIVNKCQWMYEYNTICESYNIYTWSMII